MQVHHVRTGSSEQERERKEISVMERGHTRVLNKWK
jgi:hypothetical protein